MIFPVFVDFTSNVSMSEGTFCRVAVQMCSYFHLNMYICIIFSLDEIPYSLFIFVYTRATAEAGGEDMAM